MGRAVDLEAQVEARLADARLRRRRQARTRLAKRLAIGSVAALTIATLTVGFVYAGSPERLADGVQIAGLDVGGMTVAEAERALERRAASVDRAPLVVTVGTERFRLSPVELGVELDWGKAVEAARKRGDGFSFVRGLRRVYVDAFGADVSVPTSVDRKAFGAALSPLSAAVDSPHRDAAIRLRGLEPVIVPARTGRVLDRAAAAELLVSSLAGFERRPVTLPFRPDTPAVRAADLRPALRQARIALSAPVRLILQTTAFTVTPKRLAELIRFPSGGERRLQVLGPEADAYFASLAKRVESKPKDAGFAVKADGSVRVVPAVGGSVLDVPLTARNLLAAALSRQDRQAAIAVGTKPAERTTEEARAMGITDLISSYTTQYGGVSNRLHNVRLVARLIDDTLIPPGATFSFNATTGERNAAKGFLEAPVIINGELQTGLGGGVCQVSTTVFNTAFEAGLKIVERTNHALYIGHYPQGRDATVDYPTLDLKFVNDTGRWLLLRTFVSSSSLTVNL